MHGNSENTGSQRWSRVKTIHFEAERLNENARGDYLAEACLGDAEIRREVELLLEHGKSKSIVDGPAVCNIPSLLAEADPDHRVGQQFKDYRIVRWIASGGVSDVYLIERDSECQPRIAALKLLRRASATALSIERFKQEQRVLASLHHPFIAEFHDAGIADDGQHYLVLEYVEGVPITEYCSQQNAGRDERLMLFCRVCDAVQHAHSQLLVHRDLKPSNILVSSDGTPKLLDFGGVKIIEPTPDLDILATLDPSTLPYTLPYASPEIIRGEAISTASDLFSLGLILFELITGTRPFSEASGSPFDLARAICEDDPTPPQAALRQQQHRVTAYSVLLNGEKDPETLPTKKLHAPPFESIPSDLATIIEMAIQKSADRRYASVEQFADDVRSFLDGMPVRAKRDSRGYRFSKFVKRHRKSVAGLVVFVGLLMAGVVGMSLGLRNAQRERDTAVRAHERTALVLNFLGNMLAPKNRYADGNDTTLEQVVGYANEQLESVDNESAEAAIRCVLGRIHRRFGDYEGAKHQLTTARSILKRVHGIQHEDTIYCTCELVALFLDTNELEDAARLLAELRGHFESRSSANTSQMARILVLEGRFYRGQSDTDRARECYNQALTLLRDSSPDYEDQLGSVLFSLAVLERESKDLAKAERYLSEAIAVYERAKADDHALGLCLNERALTRQMQGRIREAKEFYEKSIEAHKRALHPNHLEVTKVSFNYGTLLEELGAYPEAERRYRNALTNARRVLGEGHPTAFTMQYRHAVSLYRLGKPDKGKSVIEGAIELAKIHTGPRSAKLAWLLRGYSILLRERGELESAMKVCREFLDISRSCFGENHVKVGVGYDIFANVLIESRNHVEAEAMFEKSLGILNPRLDGGDPRVLGVRTNYGWLLYLDGRFDEAEAILRDVRRLASENVAVSDSLRAKTTLTLSEVLTATNRASEAVVLARKGLQILRSSLSLPAEHVRVAYAETILGEALTVVGEYTEAKTLLTHGYNTLNDSRQFRSRRKTRALRRLIAFHEAHGTAEETNRLREVLKNIIDGSESPHRERRPAPIVPLSPLVPSETSSTPTQQNGVK